MAENGERRELDRRIIILEQQVGRLLSDTDSEKDTRRRVNSDMLQQMKNLDTAWDLQFEKVDIRLKALEKNMYLALGALALLQLFMPILIKIMP